MNGQIVEQLKILMIPTPLEVGGGGQDMLHNYDTIDISPQVTHIQTDASQQLNLSLKVNKQKTISLF